MKNHTLRPTGVAEASPGPIALFLTGPSGCGKTALAEAWVRNRLQERDPWTLLDKDVVSGRHGPKVLSLLGADPADRDSPRYKTELRDMDYGACLDVAAAQLALGGSVVLPGPWTRELQDGRIFSAQRMGLPPVRVMVVWLTLSPEERQRRVLARAHPQDSWKLANWAEYLANTPAMPTPQWNAGLTVFPETASLADAVQALARHVLHGPSA